jgi:hypothetical protein
MEDSELRTAIRKSTKRFQRQLKIEGEKKFISL